MVNKNNPLRDGRHLDKYFPYVDFIRRPTSADIRHPKTGQIYSRPYFWRVKLKPDGSAPDTGAKGELWYLEDITANVADWKMLLFSAGSAQIISITGDAGGAVNGDGTGDVDFNGLVVANGTRSKPVFFTGTPASFKQELEIQVSTERTGAPANTLDAGLCSFDDVNFAVDSNGFVTLVGGGTTPPVFQVQIDTNTVPGTDPVVANGSGVMTIEGDVVAAHSVPIETHSRAANAFNVEVQVGSAITGAPANKNAAGLVSFDDTAFAVDANGYVTLTGGAGPAIDTIITDTNSPVVPDASGQVTYTGTSIFSDGTTANQVDFNVQATENTFIYGQGADTNVAELGPLTDGQLIIGATGGAPAAGSLTSTDGSVTISLGTNTIDLAVAAADDAILTITGDDSNALSPTSGNLNVFGLSGSKTSGTGSTLTVKSPPYADVGSTGTSVLNSGEFVTATATRTLPATGGVDDGDLLEFICTTSNILTITANTGQTIRLGGDVSSSGGTCVSSGQGDSISLRWSDTVGGWFATSAVGVWTLN